MRGLGELRGLSRQVLLLLLVVAIVSACSSAIIKPELSASESSASCRVVQHPLGETCVPNNPERIVTVSTRELLSSVLALGIKPVGSSSIGENFLSETLVNDQSHLGNRIEGIKNLGLADSISLEKTVQLKPDLILLWEYSEALYPLFSKIAPTVIIPTDESTVNWKERVNIIANVLGKEEVAQQVLNRYEQRVKALKAALGNRYQDKTVSITYPWGQNANIYVKNSFSGSILEDLGLQRPPAEDIFFPFGRIEVSEERLDLLDSDVIFLGLSQARGSVEAYERLRKNPLWQQLSAVQRGQVYPVDLRALYEASPLAADVLLDDLYKYLVKPSQPTSRVQDDRTSQNSVPTAFKKVHDLE
jgi:iron complex transport system substrate-binding protein